MQNSARERITLLPVHKSGVDPFSKTGHLHDLCIDFPQVDGKVFPSGCGQVVSIAADRERGDLARVRNETHHFVRVTIKRHLHLIRSIRDGEDDGVAQVTRKNEDTQVVMLR